MAPAPMAPNAPAHPIRIDIVNNSDQSILAYVIGTDKDPNIVTGPNQNNVPQTDRPFIMYPDGITPCYLTDAGRLPSGAGDGSLLAKKGDKFTFNIDFYFSGRVYFSYGNSLPFSVNDGPALVLPSPVAPGYNAADPKAPIGGTTQWGFFELTYDLSGTVNTNITYIDAVGVPIALTIEDQDGKHQHVSGIDQNGLQDIANKLIEAKNQDPLGDWDQLIQYNGKTPVRVLGPHQLILARQDKVMFQGYFDDYITRVWQKIAGQGITIDTQSASGKIKGHIEGDPTLPTSQLVFDDGSKFTKPNTLDIFAGAEIPRYGTGNFKLGQSVTRDLIIPRLDAAFNRTLFDWANEFPGSIDVRQYYQKYPTNLYSEICHQVNLDHLGYAFAYDDVHGDGIKDVSGLLQVPHPKSFLVEVGGIGANSNDSDVAADTPMTKK